MYHEILSTEQPCILCGMALEVVTISRDEVSAQERIERVALAHSMTDCLRMTNLYSEIWPAMGGSR